MSIEANGEQKPRMSARDLAIIVGAVVSLIIAGIVIMKNINASRVHDVIVIKGAKGAKPMGTTTESPEGGASDGVIKVR